MADFDTVFEDYKAPTFDAAWGNMVSRPTAEGATTARTLADHFGDVVNVEDFGIVGDGVTDNTAQYNTLISLVPSGREIRWGRPGTYIGRFKSTKSFKLTAVPGVKLRTNDLASTEYVIWMEGSLSGYSALGAAPAYGDIALVGAAGLVKGDLVLLYSGNLRPSDSSPVNYELIKMSGALTVEGVIYSAQTGGSPTYAKVTPIFRPQVSGFEIDMTGSAAGGGVFIRYADSPCVTDIKGIGGTVMLVRFDSCYNVAWDQIQLNYSDNPALATSTAVVQNNCKVVRGGRVVGIGCSHTIDSESTYDLVVDSVVSSSCLLNDVGLAHNGFGGNQRYKNITSDLAAQYSVYASAQGITALDKPNQIFRGLLIDNLYINRGKPQVDTSPSFYMGYGSKDIVIKSGKIANPTGGSFANQPAVRFAGPVGGKSEINLNIKSFDVGVFLSNTGSVDTAFPRSGEELLINIVCESVKILVWDNTSASCYSYVNLNRPRLKDDPAFYASFDCFLKISNNHQGLTTFRLDQQWGQQASNKIVNNATAHTVNFINEVGSSLSSTLSPASNTLTQTDIISANSPCGRIMGANTITTVDKPCGTGQSFIILCNGSVSINGSTVTGGPVTGTAGQTITMVSDGPTWRKINTPGSW